MHQQNKTRKAKGQISENLSHTNKSGKQNEDKRDHITKIYDKSQPTAEQMTIAQIIDTKSEDPGLKDKIKQVMDATQRSADEAYTALHDSDNDPNKAVNLLLEGGSTDEWSTSSKKKKVRVPTEKNKEIIPTTDVPIIASRGTNSNTIGNYERSPERLQSRRGRGITPLIVNGPTRGRIGIRSRANGRGGSLVGGRGMRTTFRKPIETWDGCVINNNQVEANHEHNCPALEEEWDNEEFTGSLANSQVFTPSSGQRHEPRLVNDDDNLNSQGQIDLLESSTHLKSCGSDNSGNQSRNLALTPSRLISHFASMQIQQQMKSPITQNCSVVIDGSLSLNQELNQSDGMTSPTKMLGSLSSDEAESFTRGRSMHTLSKYNYLTAIRGNRQSVQSNMVTPLQESNSLSDIRIPRIAQTRVRPKIPPPSKIPLTAVEMPPDVGSSLGLLDVQFGALEFGETTTESVVHSPSTPHRSPSPPTSDDLNPPVSLSHVWCQGGSTEALLTGNDRSFSPVRTGGGTNSLPSQLVDDVGNVSKIGETTTVSAFYQDSQLYQSSLYTKASPQTMYNSTYSSPQQVLTTNNTIYSTSSSQNTYSSSSIGTYGNSGYPNYQYSNYGSSHPQSVQTNSTNSYQSSMGMGSQGYGSGSSSVYGTSGLGGTSSYSTPPYPNYNSSNQHTHKTSTANNKEFDSAAPSVNLNSISHSGSIAITPTLMSSTQTTATTKPGASISSMGKGTALANLPPGVPPNLVGTHQYTIVGQGGVPYLQQPPVYYEDFQLMQQQRLPTHIASGYFELGFQPPTTRGEGMPYNMSADGRFVRADNASPVQVSSINQQPITNLDTLASSVYGQRRAQGSGVNQSGNQTGHQQPLINPTAIPPAYAYFYGGSMIPGNFQFGGPTLYPVAAAGTTSGHNNTSGGPYGKGPSSYPSAGSYTTNIYDANQGSGVNDYKNSNSGNVGGVSGVGTTGGTSGGTGPKVHQTGPQTVQSQQPANNPPTTSDISNIYTKSHSVLSKVGSYDKQGFHCATPPPFNISSQNSGMGPAPGYPQHLFIPTMAAHHNATLMHQQIHQDGPGAVSGRSQTNPPNKVVPKNNYSSTYWTQN